MFYYFEFKILDFFYFFSDPVSIQGLYVIYFPRYIKENRLDDEINKCYLPADTEVENIFHYGPTKIVNNVFIFSQMHSQ